MLGVSHTKFLVQAQAYVRKRLYVSKLDENYGSDINTSTIYIYNNNNNHNHNNNNNNKQQNTKADI
jgi:hypothetical protein